MGEPDEVGADENPEFEPLPLLLLPLPGVALVLHPHPQLVHLRKVELDEVDRVLNLGRPKERETRTLNDLSGGRRVLRTGL